MENPSVDPVGWCTQAKEGVKFEGGLESHLTAIQKQPIATTVVSDR